VFPGLDGTLPSALFCERQFSSYPDYCQAELRWQAAMPHVVQIINVLIILLYYDK